MIKKVIDAALSYAGMTRRQAANKCGLSYNSMNKSIVDETIKQKTIKELCKTIGARYEERIIFPDGQTFTSTDEPEQ